MDSCDDATTGWDNMCWLVDQPRVLSQTLIALPAPKLHLLIEQCVIIRPSMDKDDCRSRINAVDTALELCAGHGKSVVDGGWGRTADEQMSTAVQQ